MDDTDLPLRDNLRTQAATVCDIRDNIFQVIGEIHFPTDKIRQEFDLDFNTTKIFTMEGMTRLFLYKHADQFSQEKIANFRCLQIRFGLERGPKQ